MSVTAIEEKKCGADQEGIEGVDKGDDTEANLKACEGGGQKTTPIKDAAVPEKIRKKHRRGSQKHKPRKPRYKWKPYHKMTWEEKRKINERDTIRAERRREEIRQKGRPIAPYNTTQFLMDEHDTFEPDLRDSSPDCYTQSPAFNISKSEDVEEVESLTSDESFYEKDFSEMYERTHAEALHSMSKEKLIEGYVELEHRIEFLEKEVRSKRSSCSLSSESSITSLEPKENLLLKELSHPKKEGQIHEENQRLEVENKSLKEELGILRQKYMTKS